MLTKGAKYETFYQDNSVAAGGYGGCFGGAWREPVGFTEKAAQIAI